MKGCAFTGHRRIEKRHEGRISELLARGIEFAYSQGCRRFLVGGAVGFDTYAAKQVILFRMSHSDVELCVIAPCKNQSDGWSESQIGIYEYILANADYVEYVSDTYVNGCMRARNQRLVDLASIVIAYVARDASGSAQTVRMAKRAGREVYNLYPTLEGN